MADRRKSPFARFADGAKAPLRGVDFLLRHPSLSRYAIAPFAMSFLLLLALLFVTVNYLIMPFHDAMVARLNLASWIKWAFELVLWPAIVVTYTILASFVFTALANLLAGPFNDRLSQRTEEIATGKAESTVFTFREAFSKLGKSFLIQLKKIVVFIAVQVLLLGFYLVPILGAILHPAAAALVTIWFLASEFLDYPMERREVSYRMRLLFTWTNRYEVAGFGTAIAIWLAVPLLGFTALPVAVVGGTLLYLSALE